MCSSTIQFLWCKPFVIKDSLERFFFKEFEKAWVLVPPWLLKNNLKNNPIYIPFLIGVIYKNTYDMEVTKIDYCMRQQWNYM